VAECGVFSPRRRIASIGHPMSFSISNRKTGHQFDAEQSETILDAGLRNSIVFPYSCRGGTCGTCKARLVSGDIDYAHPPQALNQDEQDQGYILLCQAQPQSDVEIEATELAASAEIQIKILPCRISAMEQVAHDVMVMHLRLPASQEFKYLAGQYIDILMRDGRRRSFSMASRPQLGQDLELHIRHVPGGHFSARVFDSMKVKDLMRFQGPFGTFFLRDDSERAAILMAGGTGLAPIKALLEQAIAAQSPRTFHLFWGVRQRRDLYYHELLEDWAARHEALTYTPVLSEPDAGDGWAGETGFVHDAVLRHYGDLAAHEVYACGPPVMIDAAKKHFVAHGLNPERLFYDSFEFAVDD
jgi:CDP-4-dehydro-6-deoxyglucose reductase, E3